MKKLIAIATAFVMTLTMTSAMASFNWTNPTVNRTGKATVEVVPYVKTSDGAGGFIWKASKYAAAVSSENVYFAVKLTVAPNPDPKWISNAAVEIFPTCGGNFAQANILALGFAISQPAALKASISVSLRLSYVCLICSTQS